MLRPVFAAGCALLLAGTAAAAAGTPYAALADREIKALSAAELDDLRQGRGMGLALAAELNGYPGPRHVLDLADAIELDSSQRQAVERLFHNMQAEARRLGAELIAAERALERSFADGHADEAAVAAATAQAARLRGALRHVHLRAHLATRVLLRPEQLGAYARLRGYADGAAPHGHDPRHHR